MSQATFFGTIENGSLKFFREPVKFTFWVVGSVTLHQVLVQAAPKSLKVWRVGKERTKAIVVTCQVDQTERSTIVLNGGPKKYYNFFIFGPPNLLRSLFYLVNLVMFIPAPSLFPSPPAFL